MKKEHSEMAKSNMLSDRTHQDEFGINMNRHKQTLTSMEIIVYSNITIMQ